MPLSNLHLASQAPGTAPFPTTSYEYLRNDEIKRFENAPLWAGKNGQLV
jgi:hypothetical protein